MIKNKKDKKCLEIYSFSVGGNNLKPQKIQRSISDDYRSNNVIKIEILPNQRYRQKTNVLPLFTNTRWNTYSKQYQIPLV